MKKTVKLAALTLAAVLTLTACGTSGGSGSASASSAGTSSANAASADTLRVVLNSEPSDLDPHKNTRLTAWAVQEEIFDKLVTKDEEGNIQPDLATSWTQIDNNTWQFKLRDDVTFHDGSKLTAADVVFSFQRACSAVGSKTFFVQFDPDNMKAVDDYTVNVATKQPFAAVLNYLASARGAILCKSAVESMGDEAYGRAPVGSGPYKVENWTTGNSIILTRNDNYWGEKPACSKIEFRFITEAANRAIELETGGADIVYSLATNDADRLESTEGVQVVSGPAYQFVYVSLNMSDKTLQNEKLREALVTAMDIPSLVSAVYGPNTQVADSYMSSNVAMHASMPAKTYDPAKAKELLAEAGYPNGLNLSIKLAEDSNASAMAEIVQGMWAEIGVTASIESMEQATYLEQANAGKVQVAIATTNAVSGDPENALMIWRSTAVNAIQACDPKIDEYLDAGAAEFDATKREAIYKDAQQYLWDKDYCVPVCFPNVVYGISDKVQGFQCHPGSTPDLAKVVLAQ